MNFKRVAIIGVDPISTAIALELRAQKEPPTVVGYHPKRMVAELAQARGAFDRVERKPDRACRDADLVVVAVPLSSIRDTFAAIVCGLLTYSTFIVFHREFQDPLLGNIMPGLPHWASLLALPVAFGVMTLRFIRFSFLSLRNTLKGDAA